MNALYTQAVFGVRRLGLVCLLYALEQVTYPLKPQFTQHAVGEVIVWTLQSCGKGGGLRAPSVAALSRVGHCDRY